MTTLTDFTPRRIDGTDLPLTSLAGQVVLIVNTASACGFTPQFAGLQSLHETYGPRGLVILGLAWPPTLTSSCCASKWLFTA